MKSEIKNMKKEILLILLGAILASVPTLISTHMQNTAEEDQFILDKKIEVLVNFSKSYNKLVSNLLPQIEQFEEKILFISAQNSARKEISDSFFRSTYSDFINIINDHQSWLAEVNSNTLVINALYDINFPLYDIKYYNPIREDSSQNNINMLISILKDDTINLKKETIEQVNKTYKIMNSLSHMIKGY